MAVKGSRVTILLFGTQLYILCLARVFVAFQLNSQAASKPLRSCFPTTSQVSAWEAAGG